MSKPLATEVISVEAEPVADDIDFSKSAPIPDHFVK